MKEGASTRSFIAVEDTGGASVTGGDTFDDKVSRGVTTDGGGSEPGDSIADED